MPAAMAYDVNDKALNQAADEELLNRRTAHNTAWAYYEGRHAKQLITRPGEPDDNVTVNLVKEAVDRTVAFLVPQFPQLEIDELKETETERWLRKAWKLRGGARLLAKLAKNGAVDGHVFARLLPAEDMFIENSPIARVIVLNPANVLAWWRGDDYEDVIAYSNFWQVGDTKYRQDFVKLAQGWQISEYRLAGTAWLEEIRTAWAYPVAPIIEWQHLMCPNRFYGESELGNRGLNDKVNKVASDISRILRYHASPQTVATGVEDEGVTKTAIDRLYTISNPDAKVYNLEMQTDLISSMNYLDYLTSAYRAERRVVVLKGDVKDFQRVTTVAVRTIFMDALAKQEELHRSYEEGIAAISRGLMILGGLANAAEFTVTTHWPDPLPQDPTEQVNVLEKERAMEVVSQETAARELGRDWPVEKARMAEDSTSESRVVDAILRGGA